MSFKKLWSNSASNYCIPVRRNCFVCAIPCVGKLLLKATIPRILFLKKPANNYTPSKKRKRINSLMDSSPRGKEQFLYGQTMCVLFSSHGKKKPRAVAK